MRVICGWCHHPSPPGTCETCGRPAALPWVQRGLAAPAADRDPNAGRPALDGREVRRHYDEAKAAIESEGRDPTIEAIAARLGRSPRTVRAWKQRFGL